MSTTMEHDLLKPLYVYIGGIHIVRCEEPSNCCEKPEPCQQFQRSYPASKEVSGGKKQVSFL